MHTKEGSPIRVVTVPRTQLGLRQSLRRVLGIFDTGALASIPRRSLRQIRLIQSNSQYGFLYAQLGSPHTIPGHREPNHHKSCYGLHDGAFGLACENLHNQDHSQECPNDSRDTNIIPHGVKRASSQCRDAPKGTCSGERHCAKQVKILRCCEVIAHKGVHGANNSSAQA